MLQPRHHVGAAPHRLVPQSGVRLDVGSEASGSAWALGTVAAIAVLSWPGANAGGWVPVGLNSIAMLTEASAARLSIELVVLDAALVTAAVWSVTRSGTTVYERS